MHMLYEYRCYRAQPGRLPALLVRFREVTVTLFERHGFDPIGFWTTDVGPAHEELHYILRWEDLVERSLRWTAFRADPDWSTARADAETEGSLVNFVRNELWTPTSFSKLD
jgi:hypothetical protein